MRVTGPQCQPLDVDIAAEHPDVDERKVVGVHIMEAVRGKGPTPTGVGKEGDHIAPDLERGVVPDRLRNGVGEVH